MKTTLLTLLAVSWAVSPLLRAAAPGPPPRLTVQTLPDQSVRFTWPATAAGFRLEQARRLDAPAAWEATAVVPQIEHDVFAATVLPTETQRFFRLRESRAPLTTIAHSSPRPGEAAVAVTRETIVHFTAPLASDAVLTTNRFYAGAGGRRILARVALAADRTRATLFYLEPLPGGTRVVAVFDGTGLQDASGRPLDADGDGVEGGLAVIPFDTLSNIPVPGTAVIGRVFASELVPGPDTGTNAVNRPLAGVTITVDGMEQALRAVTDAQGNFTLQPVPPGRFFVHIDGRTVADAAAGIRYPDKSYYPSVGKAWDAVAGQTNLAGGTGEIFLPLITAGTMQPVSATQDTVVSFPPHVIASNPALAGVAITVPANTLFADDGTRGGKVGLAPVPPDRLPGPLPPGLAFPLVITIQTDGPGNFDRPVPVRFPNLPDPTTGQKLPPGAKSALWSFNHDVGDWEIQGAMTVSADGLFVDTDPGVGVIQPGWHGTQPGAAGHGGQAGKVPCEPGRFPGGSDQENCEVISATIQGRTAYCELYRIDCARGCFDCAENTVAFNSCVQYCTASFARCNLRQDECPWPPEDWFGEEEEEEQGAGLSGPGRPAVGPDAPRLLLMPGRPGLHSSGDPAGEPDLTEPQPGVHYYAIENLSRGAIELRGQAGSEGIILTRDVALAPLTAYRVWLLQAATLRVGVAEFRTRASGERVELPTVFAWPDLSADADGDRLGDDGEMIMGTDSAQPDSDADGILDGLEVVLDSNPLDGRPAVTGIVGTARTRGAAVDVWAGNDLVVTAEGTAGVSVFTAYDGSNPKLLAQVATPGTAQRVTGCGTFLAVASGEAGLSILDLGEPAEARLRHHVPLAGVQAVACTPGFAYVGLASGSVAAVSLSTGMLAERLSVTNAVWDLAVAGDHLYALTDNRLFAIAIGDARFELAGSANAPFPFLPNRRLFVGGGIAVSVHTRGYNTYDLSDPAHPVLLASGNTAQAGWRCLVDTGAGVGLGVVGANSPDNQDRDVSLYDLSDPRRTDAFLTTFVTPGIARSVALWKGLAYVADDTAGLQVLNYRSTDANRVPPGISLAPGFATNEVAAGAPLQLTANATDDVQVRTVEFFVDGLRVAADSSFPFECRFTAPPLAAGRTNLALRARAMDTGGNFSVSPEIVVPLVADTTAPRVRTTSPVGGARAVTQIRALFSEPMAAAVVTNASSFRLVSAGADGQLGTADDSEVTGGLGTYQPEASTAVLDFAGPLPAGLYRAFLHSDLADLAGNRLPAAFSWSFRVGDAMFWTGRTDDRWANPLNWSEGRLPGAEDDAVIEAFDLPTAVVHDLDSSRVRSLVTYARLQVGTAARRSTLRVDEHLRMHGDLILDGGGTIQDGTIVQLGEGRVRVTNRGGTLDGVSVEGDLVLTNTGARLLTRNGLQLNGTVRIDNGAAIGFVGDQTLAQGRIVFEGNSGFVSVDGNSTLTLGPEVLIRGKTVTLTSGHFSGSGFPRLINRGRIAGDLTGGTLAIALWSFENAGAVEVAQGHMLSINSQNWSNTGQITISGGAKATFAGAWHNAGTLVLNEGTLALGGNFRAAGLGTLQRTGGTIELVHGADLNLEGGSLDLKAAAGPWVVRGGTIRNGTLHQDEGARLIFSNFGGFLDGLTVQGDLDLTAAGTGVAVRSGLTLHGRVLLNNSGALTILGDQTLQAGEVVFAGNAGVVRIEGNATWTLGAAAVVRGMTGGIGQGFAAGSSRLINQGLIAADVPGGTLTLSPGRLENTGTLRADGATLLIRVPGFTNAGALEELNGGRVLINP